MKKLSILITSCALLFSTNSMAGSFLLNDYNLVTIEDVNTTGTLHVDGQSLIGGDLASTQSKEFGQTLNQDDISLELGGTILSGNQFNVTGSVIVDESLIGEDQNGRTTINGVSVERGNVVGGDVSDLSESIEENLTSASDAFKALEVNSTLEEDANRSNVSGLSVGLTVNDTVAEDEYAVLSIDSSDDIFTQNANQTLEILSSTVDSVAGIIINVSGTDINYLEFNSSNFDFTKVLFNFYEATTITLSRNFYGSILAPLATLTTGSNIDGTVGVRSIGTGFSAEIHEFLTTVTPESTTTTTEETTGPTEVPEPSTWLLFSGLAFILYRIRKSKRI